MRRLLALSFSVFAFAAAGCGSSSPDPFGPAPDVGAIRGEMAHPTGTFARGQEAQILKSYGNQQTVPGYTPSGASSSSGTATMQAAGALKALGDPAAGSLQSWCSSMRGAQSGSCACPGGGTLYFSESASGSQQDAHAVVRMKLDACTIDQVTEDGALYAEMNATSNGNGQLGSFDMLMDFHAKVTAAGVSASVDVDMDISGSKVSVLVRVDDGGVLVTADGSANAQNGSATYTVTDKIGTYSCTSTSGHGSCSSSTGETRAF